MKQLYLRKETKEKEYRTPLTPQDCAILIKNNYKIQFEPSSTRCYKDDEYELAGCVSTPINRIDSHAIIMGLKEFNMTELALLNKKHFYFSHAFKGQENSHHIINLFKENNGHIYDYEYIIDENGRRVIAFGYWAGFAGMYLGLLQYQDPTMRELAPMTASEIRDVLRKYTAKPKITICGAHGRCGRGCLELLKLINIIPHICEKGERIPEDTEIFINAIYLSPDSTVVFFDDVSIANYKKLRIIVDISCDIHAKNNPIQLDYPKGWLTKYTKYTDNIDIICIDNLPSLLPKDSSEEFSKKLTELFLSGAIDKFMKTFQYIQV
jgi:saccharopine dehydrogenase (NAD+, L-lysine-forming)